MKGFDLYFDESGNFEESPIVAAGTFDRLELPQHQSQLVGLLAPEGKLTKDSAGTVLTEIFSELGRALPEQVHATEFKDADSYQLLVQKTVHAMQVNRWQPVRLVNRDGLGFGDKSATYTHMVAELVVRLLTALSITHKDRIRLNIVGATVMLKQRGTSELNKLEVEEYRSRITEHVSMAAVRLGVAHLNQMWEVVDVSLRSGLYHRALQLCDTLSNASYKNFRRCDDATRKMLKMAFGPFDYTLSRTDLLDHVDQHCRGFSYALAVQAIAENWQSSHLAPDVQMGLAERLRIILRALAGQTASTRNAQLRQLADWAGQYLELRDVAVAEKVLSFMQEQVALPLQKLVEDPVKEDTDWFIARLLVYRLGNHNHRGDIHASRSLSDNLYQLLPLLASRWEHAPLLTEALTYRAVHLNDCGEYEQASALMATVDSYYSSLSPLMSDALPGMFPTRVRARYRGVALGTRLQSEMYAALADPGRLSAARRLSDEAMDEFVTEGDLQRQYQYRCQIETIAGEFCAARYWLARSFSCTEDHESLAEEIKKMHGPQQGFALLHWTRIAMAKGRAGKNDELTSFFAAFRRAGFETSPWLIARGKDFPAHGIRRHVSVASAYFNVYRQAKQILKSLRWLETTGRVPLLLIQLAAIAEVVATCGDKAPDEAYLLLRGDRKEKGFYELMAQCSASLTHFPNLKSVADCLLVACQRCEAGQFHEGAAVAAACKLVP